LVHHYQFRAALSKATRGKPPRLKTNEEKWWKDYYNPKSMKQKERLLFSR
jgi:hypothetical protein